MLEAENQEERKERGRVNGKRDEEEKEDEEGGSKAVHNLGALSIFTESAEEDKRRSIFQRA